MMRVVIFAVHVVLSFWLLYLAFQDTSCYVKPTYYQDHDQLTTMPKNSFVFGSWVNIITTLALIEWITASFALFYTELPNYIDPYNDENLGLHSTIILCTVWNVIFFAIQWMKYESLQIPANNFILYIVMLLATIAVQNYLGRAHPGIDSKKHDSLTMQSDTLKVDVFFKNSKGFHKHIEFHDRSYAHHLDLTSGGSICRLAQSAITMSLMYVVLFALVPGTLTWVLQIVFVAHIVMALNLILRIRTMDNETVGWIYSVNAMILLALYGGLIFGPNFFNLFAATTPIPRYVQVLVILLILFWILAIVLMQQDYDLRMRHDATDWLNLGFKIVYVVVIATQICEVC